MKCAICGAEVEREECGCCHGTGIDVDMNDGCGDTCEYCHGTGEWEVCPNDGDEEHANALVKQVFMTSAKDGEP